MRRSAPPRRVSEWLAATLEMWCRETGCGFESRALRHLPHSRTLLAVILCAMVSVLRVPSIEMVRLLQAEELDLVSVDVRNMDDIYFW